MAFSITFNEEKNQLLKVTRGVNFDDMLNAIRTGALLADIIHPSQKRPNQRLYVVKVGEYDYAVPYVTGTEKNEIFLKTIYPSRALTRKYIIGDDNDK